jgi:hypothetical protein
MMLLVNAATGWVAGMLTILGMSAIWLKVFPVIERSGQGQGIPIVLLMVMLILSPISISGGLIGGRIPKEGRRRDQIIYAAVTSLFMTTPFTCFLLWYTGF